MDASNGARGQARAAYSRRRAVGRANGVTEGMYSCLLAQPFAAAPERGAMEADAYSQSAVATTSLREAGAYSRRAVTQITRMPAWMPAFITRAGRYSGQPVSAIGVGMYSCPRREPPPADPKGQWASFIPCKTRRCGGVRSEATNRPRRRGCGRKGGRTRSEAERAGLPRRRVAGAVVQPIGSVRRSAIVETVCFVCS